MQCIYYKDKDGLTFNKREHIFPKALGGIERLDAGIVSDQANEFFANNLEVKTFRTSEIIIARLVHGFNKKPSKESKKNRFAPKYVFNREADSRTFGKIAFNALAKLMGKDYVLRSEFDEFRNWIMQGDNDWFHCKMGKETLACTKIVPKFAHYCTFVDDGEYIIADVCLYNYWRKMFGICKKFDNNFVIPQGYICDWKNKREFKHFNYDRYYGSYYLPNRMHLIESNIIINNISDIEKLLVWKICKLLFHFNLYDGCNLVTDDASRILEILNFDYLKNPKIYRECNQDWIYQPIKVKN